MNKEIEKYINEKVEEFRKQLIEEMEKTTKEQEEDEFPKLGEDYWFLHTDGELDYEAWDNMSCDRLRLAIGNVFKTEEEAEFALDKLKVIAELKKFAEPKDTKWDGKERHYFIGWNYKMTGIEINYIYTYKQNIIHFESEEKAKEAIEAVGEDRIKKYYLEVEE